MTKKIFLALSMMVILGSVIYGCGRGYRNHGGYYNDSYDRSDRDYNNDRSDRDYNNGSSYYNDMTTEEKRKYDALYQEYTPKIDALRDQMNDQENIINTEYSKTTPDLATLNKAIDESSKLNAEMSKLRAAYSIKMQKLFPRNNRRNRY